MSGRNGFALLAVLWLLVALGALGLAGTVTARSAVRASGNRMALMRAAWYAEDCAARMRAAVDAALSSWDTRDSDPWPTLDRHVASSPLVRGPRSCTARLEAAGSRLDANAASSLELRRLFRALGIPASRGDSLADALLDWRDRDRVPRAYGAEQDWYESEARFAPRDDAFAARAEFVRVRGLAEVAGLVTVLDVEPGRVALLHAPPAVLLSLPGLTAELVAELAYRRTRTPLPQDLQDLAVRVSQAARESLFVHYGELRARTTFAPDAWILTSRGRAGEPPLEAVLELRLVRAGDRSAIVRRRTTP